MDYIREACKKKITFVNFISRLRKLAGDRPQKDIAEAAGISAGALSNYLNPEIARIPKVDELYRLAKYFGVSMDYLYTGEEEQKLTKGTKERSAREDLEGIAIHERETRGRPVSMQCAEHLQSWLGRWREQPEWEGWTLVELRRHFPLAEPAETINLTREEGSALNRIVREILQRERIDKSPGRHEGGHRQAGPGKPG